jgi:hypothetical protein
MKCNLVLLLILFNLTNELRFLNLNVLFPLLATVLFVLHQQGKLAYHGQRTRKPVSLIH